MKNHYRFLVGLFLLGVLSAGIPDAFGESGVIRLKPDPAHSFATATETQIVVGIVGKDWAIRFTVDRENPQMPSGVLRTSEVSFIRGPQLSRYIRPSAGPPTPPLPKTDAYEVMPLSNITINPVGMLNNREPNDYLELTISRFSVAGKLFEVDGPFRLLLRGPLP